MRSQGAGYLPCARSPARRAQAAARPELCGDDPNPAFAQWVDALGEVRSVRYFPLEDGLVRYEIASRDTQGLAYRVGEWRMRWSADGLLTDFRAVARVGRSLG
ncbi:MAG: hypothetical protein R2748_16485 [Bryobacterales bacterium]